MVRRKKTPEIIGVILASMIGYNIALSLTGFEGAWLTGLVIAWDIAFEYIVVHEMAHLLEPKHNKRFIVLMDRFMPKWHFYRDHLNQLPVSHEDWGY